MNCPQITEEQIEEVYDWIDRVPFSRPKKNIYRDFADGILVMEILSSYIEGIEKNIDLQPSNNVTIKQNNWNILNQKVLKKINIQVSKTDIDHIITETPSIIQRVLKQIRTKIDVFLKKKEEPNKQMQQLRKITQNQKFRNLVQEVDNEIMQLKQVVDILQNKLGMMEQLLSIKDKKIQALATKMELANLV